jgi:small-conductance mechanosensitive channel
LPIQRPSLSTAAVQVEEIALLNTVMLRWDGARIYAPNSRLNSEQLFNLSRSASKSEVLKVRSGSCREAGGAGGE